jgi:hypothetical protein
MSAAPDWLTTPAQREHWHKPWTVPLDPDKARPFKEKLWDHGFLSPNFTRREAASKDGVSIPRHLRGKAQRHAFHMERVRHLEGDRPLKILSWFRSVKHNAAEGGVPGSQHTLARACDPLTPIKASTAEKIFAYGAIGYQSPHDKTVRHVDSRPERVRYYYSS